MMQIAMKSRLTLVVLSAAALGTTGCQDIPGILDDPSDPSFTTAPLTVTIEHIEGSIEGEALDPNVTQATGMRTGTAIQLDLVTASGLSIRVFTPGTEGSGQNPYGGGGDDGSGGRVPLPLDAGFRDFADAGLGADDPRLDPNAGTVVACSFDGACRDADDFGLEIAQRAEGRAVVLDGTWSGGDRAHVELRYSEQR